MGNNTPKPWLYKGSIWETKAKYYNWVRGSLRRLWTKYPIANSFKNSMCRKATKEDITKYHLHPNTKLIGQCYVCRQWFPKSKLQIDHTEPAGSCNSYESAHAFLDAQVMYPPEKMGLICHKDHKIKSHADNYGMTFGEAREDKRRIAFFNQPLPDVKKQLKAMGAAPEDLRNDKTRKAYYKREAARL